MTLLGQVENKEPENMDDLRRKVLELFPNAQVDEDYDGQIIIYTGLVQVDNGLEKYHPSED